MVLWLALLSFFGSFLPKLKPDFDFEKFFPLDDPDLTFYQEHIGIFDYDNDYITLIATTDSSVFNLPFLARLDILANLIKKTSHIESVASPTFMRELIDSPMGTITASALNLESEESLQKSSERFFNHPIFKSFVSADQKSILVQLKHSHLESLEKSERLLSNLDITIAQSNLSNVKIIGRLPAQRAFIKLIQEDFILFLILALTLSFLLLKLFFLTWRSATIPFLVAISTLICTMGLMALTNTPLSIVGALIPPIILFTSTSDCVHLMNAYHQKTKEQENKALIAAVLKVFLPTLLTSITTAIGFISLVGMPISPLRDFGLFSALGVIFAFLFTFTVAPVFIKETGKVRTIINHSWLIKSLSYSRNGVFITISIIAILSIVGISKLKSEAHLLADLPKKNTVKSDFDFLDVQYGGSKPWELAIIIKGEKNIWDFEIAKEVNKISTYIKDSLQVSRSWSPNSLMRYGNQVIHGGNFGYYVFPDSSEYPKIKRLIRKVYSSIPQPNVISQNNQYVRIIGFIPQIGSGETQLMNTRLERFIAQQINADMIECKVTGTTALIDKSHALISSSMIKGLLFAVLLVAIILGFYFKSIRLAAISLIPNLLPLIITAGIMGLFGITLNLTTSIIFAIAFGIAVDDTIHFIASYQTSTNKKESRLRKTLHTTGNGMILTTIIVLAGFSVFLFSSFGATFYLGLFLVIALSSALIIDLTLLPLLLEKMNSKHRD